MRRAHRLWNRTTSGFVHSPTETFRTTVLAEYHVRAPDEVTDPTQRLWIDFTLSSADRGRQAVDLMGGRAAFAGKRVLDIGCAYGGYMVAAAEAGAAHVTGIDIDERLLGLGRLQLADHGVNGLMINADVTDPDLPSRLGTFDIVFCNDIAEHVPDPEKLARSLAALLATGGSTFVQIPNGLAAEFMLRDGHYGLFGLTLLDRRRAEQWFRLHYPDGPYGVEHFAPLTYYVDMFSRNGIWIRTLDPFPGATQLDDVVRRLEHRFIEIEQRLATLTHDHPAAPPIIAAIRSRGEHEIMVFRELVARFRSTAVTGEKVMLGRTLFATYELPSWQFHGLKIGG